jgi:thioredoxin-related protein
MFRACQQLLVVMGLSIGLLVTDALGQTTGSNPSAHLPPLVHTANHAAGYSQSNRSTVDRAVSQQAPNSPVVSASARSQLPEDPTSDRDIPWLRSATQAAKLAQSTGKPILIYVRSKNCHYCDLLQQNTWQNQTVKAQVMQNAIPLKLTLEDNPEAVKAMQVKGFPSTILFSNDRKFLARVDGYFKPEDFSSKLSSLASQSQPLNAPR